MVRNGMTESSGDKVWWKDDKYHREDGPALLFRRGDEFWYYQGRQHRIGGPAVKIKADEGFDYFYYVDDKYYTKEDYEKLMCEIHSMHISLQLTDPRWWVRQQAERKTNEG